MTKPDFATNPAIGAELDRQARRLREDRRIRERAALDTRRAKQPTEVRSIADLLPRIGGRR